MAISLNNHESRINSINTNISSLGTRITNLETNPPSTVSIVTISRSGSNTFSIPSAHQSKKKFAIISMSISGSGRDQAPKYSTTITDGQTISATGEGGTADRTYGSCSIRFSKSGTNIVASSSKGGMTTSVGIPSSIKVLFYK